MFFVNPEEWRRQARADGAKSRRPVSYETKLIALWKRLTRSGSTRVDSLGYDHPYASAAASERDALTYGLRTPYEAVLVIECFQGDRAARQSPANPGGHAADFSHRYKQSINYHVESRMMELGIDPQQIG